MASSYSRETIDAKLDAIRADVRAVDAKLSGHILASDRQIVALDAKLSGQMGALDAKHSGEIGSLRIEMRVWLVVMGLIFTPILAGIGSRVASAIPFPAPAAHHGADLR